MESYNEVHSAHAGEFRKMESSPLYTKSATLVALRQTQASVDLQIFSSSKNASNLMIYEW